MQPSALRDAIPALESGSKSKSESESESESGSDSSSDSPPTAYFNTGASGPSPRAVVDAATSALEFQEYDSIGVIEGEGDQYEAASAVYAEARSAVAELLGATSKEIALTESTTDGINRIATALEWESGDVVVRTDCEHAAGILPWQRLERQHGVEVRVLETESGRLDLEAVKRAVSGARLVCVSAITWTHGTQIPIKAITELAHDSGAFVLVDAVQAPGQMPVDVEEWGADAVAAAGHKWLLGPFGAGFLYVRDGLEPELRPSSIGYRSVVDPDSDTYQWKPGAHRFEVGTTSPAPYAGLTAAIDLLEEIGLETIERRIAQLTRRLADGLPADRLLSPSEPESGLVTIAVDEPDHVVTRLREEGIIVRSLPRPYPEAIRVSVHVFNTRAEIDRLLESLAAAFQG